ncbi:MAG TPA: bifunctional tetrahydrofolate synthase/dihydrofolate synthase [Burkholderiales bacterium]
MKSLDDWLQYIERQHPASIALGLERVAEVFSRMNCEIACPVITVGGTNGKGSTCAMLEAILRAAGYRTGLYTSPHLVRYNERVRVDGAMASDAELCDAFARIEAVRAEVRLTYFEYGTLAALEIFRRRGVEAAVLEVGMGGRLDAVNAVDPDAAIVTSVGIDHTAWLGSDRESIGREKAGIFRAGRPAICGDPNPPQSLVAAAQRLGARLYRYGHEFEVRPAEGGWSFHLQGRTRGGLPYPRLRGDYQLRNAACALMALETLAEHFPLTQNALREGLLSAFVPGRFQVLPGLPSVVLDVAHNVQAAEALAANLRQQRIPGARTHAVFGMLIDKPIADVARAVAGEIDRWYAVALGGARGATAAQVAAAVAEAVPGAPVQQFPDVIAGYAAARAAAGPADRVVVFGSFYTVGDILAHLNMAPA